MKKKTALSLSGFELKLRPKSKQDWLRRYRKGGLAAMLAHKPRTGRKQSIPQWAQEALNQRLHQSDGSESYGEICQWLETQLGITAPYKTVHQLVHYRLKASPKVVWALPTSLKSVPFISWCITDSKPRPK